MASDGIWQELIKQQANLLALQTAHNALVQAMEGQIAALRAEIETVKREAAAPAAEAGGRHGST